MELDFITGRHLDQLVQFDLPLCGIVWQIRTIQEWDEAWLNPGKFRPHPWNANLHWQEIRSF